MFNTDFNNHQAWQEGWDLFDVDGRLQLQKIDDPSASDYPLGYDEPKFKSDAEAIMFVSQRAGEGSEYHLNALYLIGTLAYESTV